MAESIVFEKSKQFALRIIKLNQYLCNEKHEYVLSKQILHSGTSIGANIAEAEFGISKKDFLSKMYISLKETSETIYWLELLKGSEYITEKQFDSMSADCKEIQKILSAITKTSKQSLGN